MKKLVSLLLAVMCMCALLPAYAESADVAPALTVNGAAVSAVACYNADGALCLQLLPVAEALGYTVDKSELVEGDAYRVVYTLTPAPAEDGTVGSQLMVAYSIDSDCPTAVAISKDQMLLPLKQSMTLVDTEPYLPTEFYETGMCMALTFSEDQLTLDIAPVLMAG